MKTNLKLISASVAASILMFTSNIGNAQCYTQGTSVINLGVGFGYAYNYGYAAGYYGGGSYSTSPVFSGSYEYGATVLGPGTLGLGLAVGYQGASGTEPLDNYGDVYNYKYTTTSFGIRGLYHWNAVVGDKYDIYAGIQLTYTHYGYTDSYSGPYINGNYYTLYHYSPLGSSFYPYFIVGARYFFTPNIGAFAELGYDIAYFKIGLSFKFGGGSAPSK